MKRIFLSPYISFGLIILFCICSAALILHTIALINFQYVHTMSDLGLN